MKFPNKIISYKESILSKFTIILNALKGKDLSLLELYLATKSNFLDMTEFIDAIDCLFALNKIIYKDEMEVLHYVG